MARPSTTSSNYQSRTFALLCGVAVVVALYAGKAILLPFAIAVLLSFMLAPLADRLERYRIPRSAAVCVVATVVFTALAALSYVVLQQLYDLAYDLPKHKTNIIAKAQAFRASEDGVLERLSTTVEEVQKNLAEEEDAESESDGDPLDDDEATGDTADSGGDVTPEGEAEPEAGAGVLPDTDDTLEAGLVAMADAADGPAERESDLTGNETEGDETQNEEPPQPIPVEVVEQVTARDVARGVLAPLAALGYIALIAVFVIFMLLEREDLRNRLIKLVGGGQLNLTTQAIDDAAGRVSRYLLMQLMINVSYGMVIGVGLYFIGLPNAILWGTLTAILRFIPFLGPWIAAAMPVTLSLAVFPGWSGPLMVAGLFVVNELVSNNVLEPWLYGSSTGISTFGIILSATFWTWLWGPVGLIIATPLTVCFTVMGRYVPQLEFLNTLISDEEVLPPASNVYQRLLALDPEEALEVAEDFLDAHSLGELYDEVLLPALSLAEQDRHRGELDEAKQRFILQTMRELVEDTATRAVGAGEEKRADGGEAAERAFAREQEAVVCLPARDEADEIVGEMLTHLLAERGIEAEVLSTDVLAGEMVERLEEYSSGVVCVSALPPHAATHARYLCKRLRPKLPELKIIVGLWESGGSTRKAQQRLLATGIDSVVTTLSAAAVQLEHAVATQRVVR
jgi:predicted PurR-regulated permease PerM/methanogenic corrinoid protein MtbC1